mgnify:CR=1 FL=1
MKICFIMLNWAFSAHDNCALCWTILSDIVMKIWKLLGWHVCAQCSKSATIHCFTCPRVLCNNCLKEGNFHCITKSRGLCEGCYLMAYMIEHNETVNADGVSPFVNATARSNLSRVCLLSSDCSDWPMHNRSKLISTIKKHMKAYLMSIGKTSN